MFLKNVKINERIKEMMSKNYCFLYIQRIAVEQSTRSCFPWPKKFWVFLCGWQMLFACTLILK